ncbi:chromatin modification-related protein EAF7-domain-containing protein [Nemania sp. FL0916]|nr:chromatin modification-related protein EAF7-domain-containing protein [Nemania sp. FL0916]
MPPKRKAKALAEVSTPKASATPAHDDDAMETDTPKASETPRTADTPVTTKPNLPTEAEVLRDFWTEDQISSLFKAIMRWKPSGMHKHFRMIAISEHLRNHGFDPDVETHTRIPAIWAKLRQFFDMDMIDERDNSFDGLGPHGFYDGTSGDSVSAEDIYKDFMLPPAEFHDPMWARAAADENEPDNWSDTDAEARSTAGSTRTRGKKPPPPPQQHAITTRKRKRGDTTTAAAADTLSVAGSAATARTTRRSSTIEDTDRETPVAGSPVSRSARGARSQKRAAAKAKTESVAESEDEDSNDNSEEDEDATKSSSGAKSSSSSSSEEEEEEEQPEAPAARVSRSGTTARNRGRGRGRPKAGRKKN